MRRFTPIAWRIRDDAATDWLLRRDLAVLQMEAALPAAQFTRWRVDDSAALLRRVDCRFRPALDRTLSRYLKDVRPRLDPDGLPHLVVALGGAPIGASALGERLRRALRRAKLDTGLGSWRRWTAAP